VTFDGFSGCAGWIFGRAEVGYKTQQAIVAVELRSIRLVFHPDRIKLAVCTMRVQPVKCRIHCDRTAGEFSPVFCTELACIQNVQLVFTVYYAEFSARFVWNCWWGSCSRSTYSTFSLLQPLHCSLLLSVDGS